MNIMKINKITKMVEEVVDTQYIAEDGEIFYSEEECKKYEESALFCVSERLHKLNSRDISEYDLLGTGCDEEYIDIYDVPTEEDLELLKRYLYLFLEKNGASTKYIEEYLGRMEITCGHEVIIHWGYDLDCCWAVGDGSLNAEIDRIRNNYAQCLKTKEQLMKEREEQLQSS